MNILLNFKTVFIICFICLFGCSSVGTKMEGKYIFKFPSGEVELLTIYANNTYHQEIYMSSKEINNGTSPKYESSGEWIDRGKDFEFDHWLEYCYDGNPKNILYRPRSVNRLNVYFGNSMVDSRDYISIYRENGYVFKRIEEKEDAEFYLWEE